MDSIDYYNRYAVPYYEETVDASMEEVMKPFVELLSEERMQKCWIWDAVPEGTPCYWKNMDFM